MSCLVNRSLANAIHAMLDQVFIKYGTDGAKSSLSPVSGIISLREWSRLGETEEEQVNVLTAVKVVENG
jgi:hypothetical protein